MLIWVHAEMLTKIHMVNAMVFPGVMYGCENGP